MYNIGSLVRVVEMWMRTFLKATFYADSSKLCAAKNYGFAEVVVLYTQFMQVTGYYVFLARILK